MITGCSSQWVCHDDGGNSFSASSRKQALFKRGGCGSSVYPCLNTLLQTYKDKGNLTPVIAEAIIDRAKEKVSIHFSEKK